MPRSPTGRDFDPIAIASDGEDDRTRNLLKSIRKDHRSDDDENLRTVDVMQFDPNVMKHTSRCVIVGRPSTGKTTLSGDLCSYQCADIPTWQVHNGTEATNSNWENRGIPPVHIYDELDTEGTERFVQRQKYAIRQKVANPNAAIIFDDCMAQAKEFKGEIYRHIFMNGRNDKIFAMVVSQEPKSLPDWLNSTVDYAFLFRETSETNLKKLYDYFGSMLGTYGDFREIFQEVAHSNRCMVINLQTQSNKIEDIVHWYRTDITVPPCELGGLDAWDWDHERRNKDYSVY